MEDANRRIGGYKRYLQDSTSPVPKSTRLRWERESQSQGGDRTAGQSVENCEDTPSLAEQLTDSEDFDTLAALSSDDESYCQIDCLSLDTSIHNDSPFLDRNETSHHNEETLLDTGSAEDVHDPITDNTPIYEGSDVSKSHVLALTLAYVIRHQVSGLGLRDLIDLLNTIVPGCLPKSKYYFDKYFNVNADKIDFHFYCPECHSLLVNDIDYKCCDCDVTFNKSVLEKNGNYFLTLPIGHQLKNLFENHNLGQLIRKPVVNDNECMGDLTDGNFYRNTPDLCTFLSEQDNISFSFFTDGVPIFKSSKFSIWPLFCTINEIPYESRPDFVILHSLWFGPGKPRIDTYCKPFLDEIYFLRSNGILWKDMNGVFHCTKCTAILCVCDSVARPMLQNFKQFNGYFGCNCCLHPGKRFENKHIYVTSADEIEERTHEQTVRFAQEAIEGGETRFGVKGPSPFLLLDDFDRIRSFPVDYMHCVLLGVVRQFTELMFDSSYHDESFYLGHKLKDIDRKLTDIHPPSEIKRSPRSLDHRKYWKASEWRTYLLYYSPVILKDSATNEVYRHWLLLVNGIHLLMGESVSSGDVEQARLCLDKFVVLVPHLYGERHCSYNVHLLTHLCNSVCNWGPLWASSAFIYEGANGLLLNMFHGTQAVPLQIMNRFLAQRDQNRFAKIHLQDAADDVSDLYARLSNRSHVVKKTTKSDNCTVFGSGTNCSLSVIQALELERYLGASVQNRNCKMYDRFCFDGKLFSTASYSNQFKRDNSIVQVNGGIFGVIQHCFCCKPLCSCVDQDCICQNEVFVSLSEVFVARRQGIYDDHANMDLAKVFTPIVLGQNIHVCRVSDIQCKCVVICTGGQKYLLRLLKVDVD